jgi:hypothetical protein
MLSDLTTQCDPDAPVPQDMIDWEKAAPVGLEQFADESKEFSIGLSVRQGKPDCGHS